MAEVQKRQRGHFLQVSEFYALNLACVPLQKEFENVYLVGSVLTRPDWRDVDVRCLLEEKAYVYLGCEVLRAAVSEWLKARTGLPVDFDFQFIEQANKDFPGQRCALGIRP